MSIFHNVVENYEKDLEDIKRIEGELQDLMHEIELSPSKDMYKGYLVYKQFRELRIERRRKKEEVEILKDTYDYFNSQQGQAFKNKMRQLQGGADKLREAQERRTYMPRQRDDLTIVGQTSNEHNSFEDMIKEFNKTKVTSKKGKLRK
jgi:hypothetical protein